ncbi:MAG TPA: YajQ family cyclic di-GMP-binding protein [Methylomusa anaerophila]|uniref:Nucleotide-binding protein MAMMFC1_03057 n=1 Tax=Methylomusa anaerophila TaxID=1930071 RepID=A0A348AMR6_9FIRM|nr:YajQ family cyclic di-GMP-binding protein [Methylomusa anaerophila]BBB92364.1 putative nucleotide-binding protein [Methylomusa anaerophila]HML89997.1 YajQ family cyclic di-GMP-binding protein [Methylomusa anaerophila]
MAKDCSFDIVSEVDMQEMDNAINQTGKEISQRYDFKGSKAEIVLDKDSLKLTAEDDYKLGAMLDILRTKMVKRNVPLKCLQPGKIEPASGGTVKQTITIQKGISKEKGKEVVSAVKDLKLKVQAQIMDDQVRVTGAKKDDLQMVIQKLKENDFGIDLQFINFRS